jgi:hypothetical protein
MIDGVKISAGGKDFTVPPLNFRSIRALEADIKELAEIQPGAAMTGRQIDTVVKIIHTALTRNYPELTVAEVEDILDLGNCFKIISAILGASGFSQGEPEPGEQ